MRYESKTMIDRRASYPRTAQQANNEAVMRKEMLTSLLFGLIGLLAPFIFVLLLQSSSHLAGH